MRQAGIEDVALLVKLMSEFYDEAGTPLEAARAAEAFATLLADARLGKAFLIQAQNEEVGYVVITFSYSMEFGGRTAFVDDLFIREQFRGRGLGTAALNKVREYCAEQSVRALHLETGRDNVAAHALYRRAGFKITDRQLLTLVLSE